MVGYFGGRRPVEKRASRWKYVVTRDTIELFDLRNWKGAAGMRDGWTNGVRETMTGQEEEGGRERERRIRSRRRRRRRRRSFCFYCHRFYKVPFI